MGFFDKVSNIFFKRRKNLGLPAPEKENLQDTDSVSVEEQVKKGETKIYSDTNENGNIKYDIKWDTEGKIVFVGTINSDITSEDLKWESPISLLEMKKQINGELQSLQECKNPYELKQAKKHIVQKFKDMDSKYSHLTFSEEIWSYIERYGTKEIDDVKLSELPRQIDLSKLSKKEISKYGKKVVDFLEILGSIQTSDDTMIPENKETLIAYMKEKEEDTPDNPIVAANFQAMKKGTNLDRETVVEIAQKMKLGNEDNALYFAYLNEQERQVLIPLYRELGESIIRNSSGDKEVMKENLKKIDYIREEIESIQGGFSSELLETIMNSVNRRDVAEYVKHVQEKDRALIRDINEGKYPGMPNETTILTFLHARNGSYGQLSYKGDSHDIRTLRDFVANTDYKDKDKTKEKDLLLMVARIAEKDIRQQYGPLVDKYIENLPFKERMQKSASIGEYSRQQQGRVIEPVAFKREGPDEGERIA